mmetsp:Transcript_37546/g.88828  ORF Transcript_37546/g.88828 Transcript_37546/m.88828 type:complete len:130 (-) Transcript_37546:155-544(-)
MAHAVANLREPNMLPEGLQDGGGVNDDDAISMCSSFNSDASSNAALEDQVADRILRAMVADATWDDESELDADDYVATCFEFQHVRRLSVAFAMGQHLRLGEQSTVQCLEQGVVKDIVFMVLSSVSREW